MKEIKLLAALFISMIFLEGIAGCNKLKNGINSGGSNNPYYNLHIYFIAIKKVNTYPVGSHLLVERHGHPQNDSSVIYHYSILSRDMPFNDTAFNSIDIFKYSHYLTWKVTGINGDSLSGGRTPVQEVGVGSVPLQVNY